MQKPEMLEIISSKSLVSEDELSLTMATKQHAQGHRVLQSQPTTEALSVLYFNLWRSLPLVFSTRFPLGFIPKGKDETRNLLNVFGDGP